MRRLVLGIAVAVTSLMPVLGMADDQQIADFIKRPAARRAKSRKPKEVSTSTCVSKTWTVWFKGHVSNPAQEMNNPDRQHRQAGTSRRRASCG